MSTLAISSKLDHSSSSARTVAGLIWRYPPSRAEERKHKHASPSTTHVRGNRVFSPLALKMTGGEVHRNIAKEEKFDPVAIAFYRVRRLRAHGWARCRTRVHARARPLSRRAASHAASNCLVKRVGCTPAPSSSLRQATARLVSGRARELAQGFVSTGARSPEVLQTSTLPSAPLRTSLALNERPGIATIDSFDGPMDKSQPPGEMGSRLAGSRREAFFKQSTPTLLILLGGAPSSHSDHLPRTHGSNPRVTPTRCQRSTQLTQSVTTLGGRRQMAWQASLLSLLKNEQSSAHLRIVTAPLAPPSSGNEAKRVPRHSYGSWLSERSAPNPSQVVSLRVVSLDRPLGAYPASQVQPGRPRTCCSRSRSPRFAARGRRHEARPAATAVDGNYIRATRLSRNRQGAGGELHREHRPPPRAVLERAEQAQQRASREGRRCSSTWQQYPQRQQQQRRV